MRLLVNTRGKNTFFTASLIRQVKNLTKKPPRFEVTLGPQRLVNDSTAICKTPLHLIFIVLADQEASDKSIRISIFN